MTRSSTKVKISVLFAAAHRNKSITFAPLHKSIDVVTVCLTFLNLQMFFTLIVAVLK